MIHILGAGEYIGDHKEQVCMGPLIMSDTDYTFEKVDWHYHENPYFTFLLQGNLFESNKKSAYFLHPGSLVFYNWQEAHQNTKTPSYTRGFHLEFNRSWFEKFELKSEDFEGMIHLKHPRITNLFYRILLQSKIKDEFSLISIEQMLLDIFDHIKQKPNSDCRSKRPWIAELRSILVEEPEVCSSLSNLAQKLGVHPVHLSRQFPKYFSLCLGEYLRLQKINKATQSLISSQEPLTQIAYDQGFFDQSHFISQFKKHFSITPSFYRKKIATC